MSGLVRTLIPDLSSSSEKDALHAPGREFTPSRT